MSGVALGRAKRSVCCFEALGSFVFMSGCECQGGSAAAQLLGHMKRPLCATHTQVVGGLPQHLQTTQVRSVHYMVHVLVYEL